MASAHVLFLPLAALLLPACGAGLVPRSSDRPVALRLSFVPGQVATYRTELTGVQTLGEGPMPPGVAVSTVTDVSHRVLSVTPDGAASVEVDADPVFASTNGQEAPLGSNPEPWRILVAPEGAMLDSTRPIALDLPEDPGEVPVVQANPSGAINPFPLLASQPVRPGTGWRGSGRAPSPFGGGTVPFEVEAVLRGYELIAGVVPAALIESRVVTTIDLTVPADEYLRGTGQSGFDLPPEATLEYDGELTYVQRTWLEPELGQVIRTEIGGRFVTDVAWTGVPAATEGYDPMHIEGSLQAITDRTA